LRRDRAGGSNGSSETGPTIAIEGVTAPVRDIAILPGIDARPRGPRQPPHRRLARRDGIGGREI